jgi:hypothetical protein
LRKKKQAGKKHKKTLAKNDKGDGQK